MVAFGVCRFLRHSLNTATATYTVRILGTLLKLVLTHLQGFDLSAMSSDVYEDAIVDVVGPETLVSEPCVIKVSSDSRSILGLLIQ